MEKKKNIKINIVLERLLSCLPRVSAATSSTQNSITWRFDSDYKVGQFVNGDCWVLGPTITRIIPDADYDLIDFGSGICTGFTAGINVCSEAWKRGSI